MERQFEGMSINSTKDTTLVVSANSKRWKKKRRQNKRNNSSHPSEDNVSNESKPPQDNNSTPNRCEPLCAETCASMITQKVYLEPRGLVNVKNSCFLNASLQLLFHIPPLCALLKYLESIPGKELNHQANQPSLLTTLLGVFSQFGYGSVGAKSITQFERLNQFGISTFSTGTPAKIDSELRKNLCLDAGIQEDVAECLTRILSQLHEELGSLLSHSSNNGQQPLNSADGSDSDSDWIVTDRAGKRHPVARTTELDGGQSPIGTLFSGTLMTRSSVQTLGNNTSYDQRLRQNETFSTKEPFFILPLEIYNPKISSIESALRHLTEPEQVMDYRDASESRTSMRRRTVLDHLPPYLLLQLKRFTYVNKESTMNNGSARNQPLSGSWTTQKCLKLISIDQEIIIPKALLSQEKYFTVSERRYRLLGVIFHLGDSATSGHYTTAVRWTQTDSDPSNTESESTQFIYVDDARLCLVANPKSIDSLLCTHQPLDPESGSFYPLQKRPNQPANILYQARTPYILLYESQIGSPN